MKLIEDYTTALQALYDHIGFKEDWAVFPIDDGTDYFWKIDGDEVTFYDTLEAHEKEDDSHTYSNEIMIHRFYKNPIYRGGTYTGILVDTHTDGNKFLQIFLNTNEIK